jgi:hypothetical protein
MTSFQSPSNGQLQACCLSRYSISYPHSIPFRAQLHLSERNMLHGYSTQRGEKRPRERKGSKRKLDADIPQSRNRGRAGKEREGGYLYATNATRAIGIVGLVTLGPVANPFSCPVLFFVLKRSLPPRVSVSDGEELLKNSQHPRAAKTEDRSHRTLCCTKSNLLLPHHDTLYLAMGTALNLFFVLFATAWSISRAGSVQVTVDVSDTLGPSP